MPEKVAIVVLSQNGLKTSTTFYDQLSEHTDPQSVKLCWIDNGSTDGTVDWLKEECEFEGVTLFSPHNLGVILGRNVGFEVFLTGSSGLASKTEALFDCDYLLFLDNDQYVRKGWLEQHLAVINSGYDIIGVEAWQMNKGFLPISRTTRVGDWFNYVGCGGMMIRRSAVEKLGSFDIRFNPSYYEDPDYCFRAAKERLKVGWNAAHRITHLPHQTLGNAPDKVDRFTNSLKAFRQKWKDHMPPRFVQTNLSAFDPNFGSAPIQSPVA